MQDHQLTSRPVEGTTGLRERKKQRTREAIVEAAFELFEERGFDGTTIADIADAAEIAPRTFFSYFPSKDSVVFHDFEQREAEVAGWLRDRDPGTNAFDALRAGIEGKIGDEADPAVLKEKRWRHRLVQENDSLAAHSEHLRAKFADLIAEAVAEDLGDAPDDLRPRLVSAAATAAMVVIDDLPADDPAQPMATIDDLLAFLRGGLAALQARDRG
jgi:AcrR family transcriptional regulator